jgi:hypothetical protein
MYIEARIPGSKLLGSERVVIKKKVLDRLSDLSASLFEIRFKDLSHTIFQFQAKIRPEIRKLIPYFSFNS